MKAKTPYLLLLAVFLYSFYFFVGCDKKNITSSTTKLDSISLWIEQSKKLELTKEKRQSYLTKAYNEVLPYHDTIKTKIISDIARQYFEIGNDSLFKKINKKCLDLSIKIKDTSTNGHIHWNYAYHYINKLIYDSAYYHYDRAYKSFKAVTVNNQLLSGRALYNMAFIKGRFRDYTGSEILTIKAISKYELLKENLRLYRSYTQLAILNQELNDYKKAIDYHEKSLEYLNKVEEEEDKYIFYKQSLNVLGLIYHKQEDFEKAIYYFDEALKNYDLKTGYFAQYARLLDNRAYSKFLNKDTAHIKQDYYTSLRIRDSLNIKGGVVSVKLHLAEYYKSINDSLQALKLAKEAKTGAKEIKNGRDYLVSLKLLSELDKNHAKEYLEQYIVFNDSLRKVERKNREKYTRISYETDELVKETRLLSQQKIWISVTSLATLLILSLLYFLKIQNTTNEKLRLETEKLRLETEQQREINILSEWQQAKLEEEKTKERNRISEELHDGVLGKLFGARVGLGFLDIEGPDDVLQRYQSFQKELQTIEKEIREVTHRLNNNFASGAETNFITILKRLLESKEELGNFTYQLEASDNIDWERIHEETKVNIYRIIQESLQNIIKHANAKKVIITLLIEKENLVVMINDNGIGFQLKKSEKGIGIKNMKSRIQKLNGTFKIYTEINKGTTIYFSIPK